MSFAEYLGSLLTSSQPSPETPHKKTRPVKSSKNVKPVVISQPPPKTTRPFIRKKAYAPRKFSPEHQAAALAGLARNIVRMQAERNAYWASIPYPSLFPLSEYAKITYGVSLCYHVLSLIQVCEHGWTCSKCCHLYTGHIVDEITGQTTRIRLDGFRIVLSQFIFELFYERWHIRERLFIRSSCENIRCMNLQHIVLYPFKDPDDLIEGQIHFWLQGCIHGDLCTECCWLWYGDMMEHIPFVALWNNKHVPVRNYLYRKYINSTIRVFVDYLGQRCKNRYCVNYHHSQIMPRLYYPKKKVVASL